MTKDKVRSTEEALKLALEALETCNWVDDGGYGHAEYDHVSISKAITAIKEVLNGCQCPECKVVLHASDCAVHNEPAYPKGECNCGAQPEQEPVAWLRTSGTGSPVVTEELLIAKPEFRCEFGTPLYLTQRHRPWIGLTDWEISSVANNNHPLDGIRTFARAIEAAVWEKQK